MRKEVIKNRPAKKIDSMVTQNSPISPRGQISDVNRDRITSYDTGAVDTKIGYEVVENKKRREHVFEKELKRTHAVLAKPRGDRFFQKLHTSRNVAYFHTKRTRNILTVPETIANITLPNTFSKIMPKHAGHDRKIKDDQKNLLVKDTPAGMVSLAPTSTAPNSGELDSKYILYAIGAGIVLFMLR